MIKKNRDQALEWTKTILENYWQGDITLLKQVMHENILWIGSTENEYIHGRKNALQRLQENQAEMPPVFLDAQQYEIINSDACSCLVVGKYRAYTKPESKILLSEKQRISFLWIKEESLKLKHIHLSNVLHIQEENEKFPTKAGKETYLYLKRLLAERNQNEVVRVTDCNHVTRVLNYSEILYIKSDHNYIRIYKTNLKEFRVRGNISIFVKNLPENFLLISRSAAVNTQYIKSVSGRTLTMMNEIELTMASTRLRELQGLLSKNNLF